MNIQKFFNIPKKAKMNPRLILIGVVLAFITIVIVIGMLVYNYYGLKKRVEPIPRVEDRKEGEIKAAPDERGWRAE